MEQKKEASINFLGSVTCKLEMVYGVDSTYPFQTTIQAIHYYAQRNPARQKAINLLEPDRIRSAGGGSCSNEDVWAAVCLAMAAMLKSYNWCWQVAFAMFLV